MMKQWITEKNLLTQKEKNMLDGQAKSRVFYQCKKTESRMRLTRRKRHELEELLTDLDT